MKAKVKQSPASLVLDLTRLDCGACRDSLPSGASHHWPHSVCLTKSRPCVVTQLHSPSPHLYSFSSAKSCRGSRLSFISYSEIRPASLPPIIIIIIIIILPHLPPQPPVTTTPSDTESNEEHGGVAAGQTPSSRDARQVAL
jgi:hypothetical protein